MKGADVTQVWNHPPNWPTVPKEWEPPPGWEPEYSWGPAPAGWQFWVESRPGVARQRSGARRAFRAIRYLGLIVLLLSAVARWDLHRAHGASSSTLETGPEASLRICHEQVDKQLESPATAKYSDDRLLSVVNNGRTYSRSGNVDSDNRLGVPLRSFWLCQVTADAQGRQYTVDDVKVSGP